MSVATGSGPAADPVTWLYTPGDRPERLGAAARYGADVAIWDLEDSVSAEHKASARDAVVAGLDAAAPGSVEIRVNHLSTPWGEADLRAIDDHPALRAVRLPKVDGPDDVRRALGALSAQGVGVVCLLESARGLEAAFDIAGADARVMGIGLGEGDLSADLGVGDESGLAWARSRVVVAARARGLGAVPMSAYPAFDDLEGLAASCRAGRSLGLFGRAAIHPSQLPVIRASFAPTQAEVDRARQIVDSAETSGEAVVVAAGTMVDAAVVAGARAVLTRAARTAEVFR